jgi:predicted kinase/CRISPR/Cas system-associated endonuclease Cas3-HD
MTQYQFTHKASDRLDDIRRAEFLEMYDQLRVTPMFQTMEDTVEASPWHREANVKVHTDMVVSEYVIRTDAVTLQWSRDDFLGAVSCAFHDTGKPASKIAKFKEDRGNYFAFHGHETVSSRMFETWAMEDGKGMFAVDEIFKICWMIEHHMPWSIEDKEKRRWLALTAWSINADVYTRALLADQYGRIADDKEAKDKRSEEWVAEFLKLVEEVEANDVDDDAPVMFVLIGTSGSGKSTMTKQGMERSDFPVAIFSLDALRHEWYDTREGHEGYRAAYDKSVEDKDFESKADRAFSQLLQLRTTLIVDNVNAGVKRRGKYIRQARQKGYRIVAVTMPVSINVVLERQHSRVDKNVPDHAVRQQYASIQQPSLGEFDDIIMSPHNMTWFDPNPSGDY